MKTMVRFQNSRLQTLVKDKEFCRFCGYSVFWQRLDQGQVAALPEELNTYL